MYVKAMLILLPTDVPYSSPVPEFASQSPCALVITEQGFNTTFAIGNHVPIRGVPDIRYPAGFQLSGIRPDTRTIRLVLQIFNNTTNKKVILQTNFLVS